MALPRKRNLVPILIFLLIFAYYYLHFAVFHLAYGEAERVSKYETELPTQQYYASSQLLIEQDSMAMKARLSPFPGVLFEYCSATPNQYTNHIRISSYLYNISDRPRMSDTLATRMLWNPTIIALPYWSKNPYLVISMVYPKGDLNRESLLCEAVVCSPSAKGSDGDVPCMEYDYKYLGASGGMRCVTEPVAVILPQTTAHECKGDAAVYADVTGFHDPRLFYSGLGQPVLMVSSQSRYTCVGVWIIDLRTVYPSLKAVFDAEPDSLVPGPQITYPTFTELSRNPSSAHGQFEKNWILFSPTSTSNYLQYELMPNRRTVSKLVDSDITTTNLTDPLEQSCLFDLTTDEVAFESQLANASWHQATPALKLLLCNRTDLACHAKPENTVFFAAIHRKHTDVFDLPDRYERYFVVWSSVPPFRMIGMSRYPVLFMNETTNGWTAEETWDDVEFTDNDVRRKGHWARFTYTTTIAWAWRRRRRSMEDMNLGYWDDEVILSVGVDDKGQVFGRVGVRDLLQCLRPCSRQSQ